MAVEITRASPDRLAPLASVFGRSFVEEPMLRWSLGHHGDVAERFIRYFAYSIKDLIPLGMVWEAGAADGVALWFPPDNAQVWQEMQTHDALVEGLTLDGGRRYSVFWKWVESRIPDEPLWHLDAIAVEPEARGRGIGSALIEHGLALARTDGLAAVLETGNPRNLPYYEAFGFRVVDESESPDDGPRVWFMRRDPLSG
jgi:ribosomal protein S18 acetylase RimI-like enzyme